MSVERLFSPLKLGNLNLQHRIVMPPMTRFRADEEGVPSKYVKEYYSQRAAVPGTLMISEATFVSPGAGGMDHVPGIWNAKQVAAWKEVTDAVHAKECFIYLQLWALGNRADPEVLARAEGGPYRVVGASSVPVKPVEEGGHITFELSKEDINLFVKDFAAAAKNAMSAGFDGVEIHGANGYLFDQFWHDVCNKRLDEYGGSIENRARFGVEVTKAVIEAVGDSKKVGMRLSPWTELAGMKTEAPVPQFLHIVGELKKLNLAYLHLVGSRLSGDAASAVYQAITRRNVPFVKLWGSESPIILAGGFTPENVKPATEEIYTGENVCIAIGRYWISTPDLVFRLRRRLPMNAYDRSTFYKPMIAHGYTDYLFDSEYMDSKVAAK